MSAGENGVLLDLSGVDPDEISKICDRYGIAELAVFGSVARGAARQDSDLDLLYTLAPGRHLGFSINDLEDELTDLFGRPIDLVARSAVHRMMRDEVLTEAQTLYAA